MMGGHVHQTISFYDGKDGELRIKFDDGAVEGRMVVDRVATDEDKKAQKQAYAAYLRTKPAAAVEASVAVPAAVPKAKSKSKR